MPNSRPLHSKKHTADEGARPRSESEYSNDSGVNAPKLQVLFRWAAPERIWEPKTRLWYVSYGALISVLILVAIKLGYPILVIGLIAFLFLWFVQGTIEPLVLQHQVTTTGIISGGALYDFTNLNAFWMAERHGFLMLYLDFDKSQRAPRATILADLRDADRIFDLMIDKVKYANEDEAGYNIFAQWIYGKYIPITKFIADLDDPISTDSK
jgi:hypothetical protein